MTARFERDHAHPQSEFPVKATQIVWLFLCPKFQPEEIEFLLPVILNITVVLRKLSFC